MIDPYKIEGPAVISFSGGRTSGYMLARIIDAHGGMLPTDVVPVFANTGKEKDETLDFVHECGQRWNVPIKWVEYQSHDDPQQRWKEVTYETASRNGEPFDAMIERKKYLPNAVERFCTIELKIRTAKLYAQQVLGFEHWDVVVGFRADEPTRVAKLSIPNKEPFERIAPLATDGVTKQTVGKFWKTQPFDLRLPNNNGTTMEGNCDLCFLKALAIRLAIVKKEPHRAIWWIQKEQKIQSSGLAIGDGDRFCKDKPSYASILEFAQSQQDFIGMEDESLVDCACTD